MCNIFSGHIVSNDEDWEVRYEVARSINTPKEVLVKLSNDENWSVKYIAKRNLR